MAQSMYLLNTKHNLMGYFSGSDGLIKIGQQGFYQASQYITNLWTVFSTTLVCEVLNKVLIICEHCCYRFHKPTYLRRVVS